MANITKIESEYLEKFDIHCNKYLTYAQIQQIVEATMKFHTWAERQQNIDMLILVHATDMTIEEIEKHTHDELIQCGLIDEVTIHVDNVYRIYEALEYHESIQRVLAQILSEVNKFMDMPVGKNTVQKFARKAMNDGDNKH